MKRRSARRTYVVTIPGWVPTSVNTLLETHPKRRGRYKRADALVVDAYCGSQDVPEARGKRRVRLAMRDPSGRGDPDNFLKSGLDALVTCKRLVDDSSRYCEIDKPTLEAGPRQTVITLEDLYP